MNVDVIGSQNALASTAPGLRHDLHHLYTTAVPTGINDTTTRTLATDLPTTV